MKYIINIKKKAKKFIDKQPPFQRKRIYEAIQILPKGDIKNLKNYPNTYRLRIRWLQNNIWMVWTKNLYKCCWGRQ